MLSIRRPFETVEYMSSIASVLSQSSASIVYSLQPFIRVRFSQRLGVLASLAEQRLNRSGIANNSNRCLMQYIGQPNHS